MILSTHRYILQGLLILYKVLKTTHNDLDIPKAQLLYNSKYLIKPSYLN